MRLVHSDEYRFTDADSNLAVIERLCKIGREDPCMVLQTRQTAGANLPVLTENSIALKKGEWHLEEGTNSSVSENTCRIAAL
jgi:hypothetical protein